MEARMGKPFKPLPRMTMRSRTVAINVVQFNDNRTTVNVFNDGRAESSHGLPGHVSLAEALIWYGTTLKLQGE
ncbi:MAG: hypothetical protein RJA99_3215 [Pseudomonadota bacterium]|jgi:hypothetical protein